jgi:hypothetical protein
MKKQLRIISTARVAKDSYNVEFNDGILLNIKYKPGAISWEDVGPMCSLGLDSYFCEKGSFPKGHNLRKRLLMGTDLIKARMKRYKSNISLSN